MKHTFKIMNSMVLCWKHNCVWYIQKTIKTMFILGQLLISSLKEILNKTSTTYKSYKMINSGCTRTLLLIWINTKRVQKIKEAHYFRLLTLKGVKYWLYYFDYVFICRTNYHVSIVNMCCSSLKVFCRVSYNKQCK